MKKGHNKIFQFIDIQIWECSKSVKKEIRKGWEGVGKKSLRI